MSVRDLSTEFSTVAHLTNLASWLALDNMTRVSTVEDAGYTMPHDEASQLMALLFVTRDYAARILSEMDAEAVAKIAAAEAAS